MTNERKHSPLPWTINDEREAFDADEYEVAYLSGCSHENKDFIALACNSFYDMREALAKMIEEFGYQSDRNDGTQSEGRQRVLSDAHGALRKAGVQ
jgi:hypothetical protein